MRSGLPAVRKAMARRRVTSIGLPVILVASRGRHNTLDVAIRRKPEECT